MADVTTSAAAPVDKSAPVKPERPDEETYKTNLAKAEKDLKAAEERMVRWTLISLVHTHADIRSAHFA
jgi:hypothetical protein